ncbi:MAG: c-type cytochrome [Marinobacterium sp.]|nr:c-type cytochrome [Marinobacterium sp.]
MKHQEQFSAVPALRRCQPYFACVALSASLALTVSTSQASIQITAPAPTTDFSKAEAGEHLPGGSSTHLKRHDKKAFTHPSANMPFEQQLDFKVGNGIFKKIWVSSPSSTTASDGLGPLYNARSCMRCHVRDGRGHTPDANYPDDNATSMFLRLSIPPQNADQRQALAESRQAVIPEPTYGGQLQDFAIQGLPIEGRMYIRYTEKTLSLSDGESASLRVPEYSITDLGFGPLHPQTMISPRVAPPMIGLGLLEAIPEAALRASEDPHDRDGDGISGRANIVWNGETGRTEIGRFGWKAGMPTLNQQNNSAFNGDIGISNAYFSNPAGDCTEHQPVCLNAPNGNTPAQDNLEASRLMSQLLLYYSRNLAVPARKNVNDPQVLAGKEVFYNTGCIRCHTPKFDTGTDTLGMEQRNQLIWPYTDLLLHDMGEGLADNRPEYQANGREWRTPPLWGIGLTKIVNGKTHFLHDGRARNLLEAVLWHGGEAEAAKQAVIHMNKDDRANLIRFLESL